MKRAFVLPEQGVINIYFIRDERPRIQWLIDLGIPRFSVFMLELPIPLDNPGHTQIVFHEGTALILEQIKAFLSETEFGEDAGVIKAMMQAIKQTEMDFYGTELMYGYEILFPLSQQFYDLVHERIVNQKTASEDSGAWSRLYDDNVSDEEFLERHAGREEDISKSVWRAPDTSKRMMVDLGKPVQKRDKQELNDARKIIDRYKQTIYKSTPGPLFVILYDRNGLPRGVSRVTNKGLTKWADGSEVPRELLTALIDIFGEQDADQVKVAEEKPKNIPKDLLKKLPGIHEISPEGQDEGEGDNNWEEPNGYSQTVRDRLKLLRERTGMELPVLGEGSSRMVVGVNEHVAIKLAINQPGVAQNKAELRMYEKVEDCTIITRIFYYDTEFHWLVVERVLRGATYSDFERYGATNAYNFCRKVEHGETKSLTDRQAVKSLQFLCQTLGVKWWDIDRESQWGLVERRGERYPVLVDYGLDEEVARQHYSSKLAAGWGSFINGEYWVDGDSANNYAECSGDGDYTHETYAREQILNDKWDQILSACQRHLQEAHEEEDDNNPGEVEEEWRKLHAMKYGEPDFPMEDVFFTLIWGYVSLEECDAIFNGEYDMFKNEVREFFMRFYNQIRVVDKNFEVWKLTPRNLDTIIDWVFNESGLDESDLAQMKDEVYIEQYEGGRKYAGIPIGELLNMKNPGEVWRYQGMTVASKQAAMVELPHDKEVKLPLYMLKKLKQMAQKFDPQADFRFVGGCVRDMLLDRKPKDFDVVTNTTADTLQKMGLENVGKAFPVYLYHDPTYGQIEIAVARSEEKTGVGHKDFDIVPTGNFEGDMVRRDLNVNAMMVDADGKLFGPTEALQNIKDKTLQNVSEKFAEDALRVFRAARFSAQFGSEWRVSPQLVDMMHRMQPELQYLPADRIREETKRALVGKVPMRFFEVLREGGCLEPWFSEFDQNWSQIAESVNYGHQNGWDFDLQIVGIESQLPIPDSLNNRLGLSNQIKQAAQFVKKNRGNIKQARALPKETVVGIVQSGVRGAFEFVQLLDCALLGTNPDSKDFLLKCAEAIKGTDMTGVTSRNEATERLVGAISKVGHSKRAMSAQQAVNEAVKLITQEEIKQPKPWQTPQFRAWFGDSKVVNKDGTPKRVMHGTTHEFDQFSLHNAFEEGWYGKGFYFTDCEKDVENYASLEGPDLTARIELVAERLMDDGGDWEESMGEEYEDNSKSIRELAHQKAQEMIAGKHHGTVYLTYLKMENPVIVTPNGGTYLGGDSGSDPENEDEWLDGPETTKLYEAIQAACSQFGLNEKRIWDSQLSDRLLEGCTAYEFEKDLRENGETLDAEGGAGPVISAIYEAMGFDGIIMDAKAQFGNGNTGMKMSPKTRHYIVWNPRQVKSAIGNKGTFDPSSPLLTAAVKPRTQGGGLNVDPVEQIVDEETPEKEKTTPLTQEEEDMAKSLADKRISPAAPSNVLKPGAIDPHSHAQSQPDLKKMMENEKFEFNVNLAVDNYPNFKYMREGRYKQFDAHEKAEEIINHMAANLIWLYKTWDKALADRAKLWYVGGNRIIHRWADKFHLDPHKVAAVIAALSPQAHWFQNVTTAERTIEALVELKDFRWDWKMDRVALHRNWTPEDLEDEMKESVKVGEAAEKKKNKKESAKKEKEPKIKWSAALAIPLLRGKTLNEVLTENSPESGREYLASVWIRAWAEGHTDNKLREVTPEGNFGDWFKTGKADAKVRWTSFAAITKAVRILESNSVNDISKLVGTNHKVRSFYNNLIAPMADEGDVTIDTHAVAAALIRPLSGASVEVAHNFGSGFTPKKDKNGKIWVWDEDEGEYVEGDPDAEKIPGPSNSSITGLNGLYALYAEAYRRAAKDPAVGVLPRELQSITWEAVRALFNPADKRDKKFIRMANEIWASHDPEDGGLNAEQAREKITAVIKERRGGKEVFETPSWIGSDPEIHGDAQGSSYKRGLSGSGIPGSQAGGITPTGIGGGASRRTSRKINSPLLMKIGALTFKHEHRDYRYGQNYFVLFAFNGKFCVGEIRYSVYEDGPYIDNIDVGNHVLTNLETKKLMSERLRKATDPTEYVGHEMLKYLQKLYPDKDLGVRHADAAKGLDFDEVETEYAPLMDEKEALTKEQQNINQALEENSKRNVAYQDWEDHYKKLMDRWNWIDDRLYEIEQALNVYPTPVRQKRLIRTT